MPSQAGLDEGRLGAMKPGGRERLPVKFIRHKNRVYMLCSGG
ncbi:MAG: hypothetical protein ACI395_09895 [Candidatus Cryptobacteroides sp.]